MNSSNLTRISIEEIESILGSKLNLENTIFFEKLDFSYELITGKELELIHKFIEETLNSELTKSGKHRKSDWEYGWRENLLELNRNNELSGLTPKYFGKFPLLRWQQNLIRPSSLEMESNFLKLIVRHYSSIYFGNLSDIYEFGCGTGHNLLELFSIFPGKQFCGLDWAKSSQEILKKLAHEIDGFKLNYGNFDFFEPDDSLKLNENSGVLTVAALEQVGSSHEKFIEYILRSRPKVVINVEPIAELLDEHHKLDAISIKYFEKRNYLKGYLSLLRELETNGRVKIIDSRRSYLGSLFIEGYSVIIWSPRYNDTK